MKGHLLIVAGDPSADRHGAALVRALKSRQPPLRVTALGGDHLKSVADKFLYPLVGVGGFGFWEPLMKLPQLAKARAIVRDLFKTDSPDLVIPMDYYGFNIHIARLAHAHQIPVVYYIGPQVWASRAGRIQKLRSAVDTMLVILPFESKIYESSGVPVRFVGHPLVETLPEPQPPASPRTLGLLPGSRRGVVQRHLPIMVETAKRLRAQFPDLQIVLFRPAEIEPAFYAEALSACPFIRLVREEGFEERRKLWVAISVSGTSALENMLLGIPMIIMYRLSTLTYLIAKQLIRVPFVGMPNILAGKSVVPELLQQEATPESLADATGALLKDDARRSAMRETLLRLRASLGRGGSAQAADEILKFLETRNPVMAVPQKVVL